MEDAAILGGGLYRRQSGGHRCRPFHGRARRGYDHRGGGLPRDHDLAATGRRGDDHDRASSSLPGYAPNDVEVEFCELRLNGVPGSSALSRSMTRPAYCPPEWSHASGISLPYASRVMLSGSGPPRTPVSSASIAAICSLASSKPKTSKFSAMRAGLVDFGIAERPSCRCQRSIT